MTAERMEALNKLFDTPMEGSCSVCGAALGPASMSEMQTLLAIHARWRPRHDGAVIEDLQPVGVR